MVNNNINHLSSSLLWQQVKCAAKHIDIKLYVVKEIVRNHNESIEQVLVDPLTKGLPKAYHSVRSENTQLTWIYGKAYDF
jgi:hypothetical protein